MVSLPMILTLPLIGSTCRWYVIGGRWNSPVRMSSAPLRANRSRSGWRSRNRLASPLWPLPLRQASMHSRTNAGSVTGECLQYVLIFRVLISYGDNGGFRCVYRPPSRFDFRNWPGLCLLASHAGGSRDGMVVFAVLMGGRRSSTTCSRACSCSSSRTVHSANRR